MRRWTLMAAIALAASGELGHDWTTIHPISFLNIHTHIYIYLYKIKSSSRHQGNIYLFFIVPLGSRPRDDRFSRDAYGKNRVLIHLNSDHIFCLIPLSPCFSFLSLFFLTPVYFYRFLLSFLSLFLSAYYFAFV